MDTIKFVQIGVVCTVLNLSIKKLIKTIDVAVTTMLASQLKIGTLSTSIDVRTLADMLNAHPDTIRKSITRLKDIGLLEVTARKGRSNIYTFNLVKFSGNECIPIVKTHINYAQDTDTSLTHTTLNPAGNSQHLNNNNYSNDQIEFIKATETGDHNE